MPIDLQEMRLLADGTPKAPKKLKGKALDREIERVYKQYGQGVQIGIMDIPKIFRAGREAYETGGAEALAVAIQDAVARLRKN